MVEVDHARPACLIQAKIEALAVELRKHVMEERIEVGEFDRASQWDYQQVRTKALVLLLHPKVTGRHQRFDTGPSYARFGREPDHHCAMVQELLSLALHQFNANLNVDGL